MLLVAHQTLYFQHDEAPAYNAHIIRDHLNQVYEGKWFGTYSEQDLQILLHLIFFYGDI
jgi:hypothetical protein